MKALSLIFNSFVFWSAWVIIPVIAEILPSLGSLFVLLKRRMHSRRLSSQPIVFPEISMIIPVYNSAGTLRTCLQSVYESTYPTDKVRVFLVNNGSKDDSFSIYTACQKEFPELSIQWLNAEQGKSRALNLALYNSKGKYVINMDSDGYLEPHALENMVIRFEANPDLNCMTGAILTMPEKIREYKGFFAQLLRKLEFVEYAQAFLAGRSYASENNAIYTVSGAFSAFRISAIMTSWLYNPETVCEDTQLTFQLRYYHDERVEVCEDAIFFTEPIESVNKLYTQRQRWQRGSLEVAEMFQDSGMNPFKLFRDVNIRTLIYDHTFAFPRLIWYLALLCMICMKYSGRAVIISTGIIFGLYIAISYFYYISVLLLLRKLPEIHSYYLKQGWVVALLPLFNCGIFFVRVAGIINSIGTNSAWRTRTLSEERASFTEILRRDAKKPLHAMERLRRWLNKEPKPEKETKGARPVAWYVLYGVLVLLGAAVLFTVRWVAQTYGVGINEIISTLTGNLQGTSKDVVLAVVKGCVVPTALAVAAYAAIVIMDRRLSKRRVRAGKSPATPLARVLPTFCAGFLAVAVLYTNVQFDALAYYMTQNASSGIYEEYYVDPEDVAITPGEQKKNLIYIYLESMETTYASVADGGRQETNYIPNLTQLARDNISFSDNGGLGGFHTVTGAGYTMAALFATTTGVPYALPVESTSIESADSFASGIVGLGDILQQQGYRQEFLCGSDATFGGRRLYFTQHGDYEIFDLFTAREKGYIPSDYFVWWGFEDYRLFDMAKDELTRLSAEPEPFNLTMLTVDLHHISGYTCEYCGSAYDVDTANVAACTDQLVAEFVEWCAQQPFYEDTVIVITGDHPRMDTYLVDGVSYYDRTVYNCILNSAADAQDTQRTFTHMDMFPTVLAAMGNEIEGDRLGLGTNLFSDEQTLAEQLGFDYINTEVSKSSSYYVEKFAPELSGGEGG